MASPAVNLSNGSKSFEGLLDLIQQQAAQWDNILQGYAISLFWLLAGIQLCWTGIQLVLKGADLTEIMSEMVRLILTLGFFLALLNTPNLTAQAVTRYVIASFEKAGAAAGGSGSVALRPGDIFAAGLQIVDAVTDVKSSSSTSTLKLPGADFFAVGKDIFSGLATALSVLLILLCFAFMTAFDAVTIVESYVVINASILFIGFGGAQWTREYAIAPLRYSVAVGTKLFLISLIVGLVTNAAKQWAAAYTPDLANATSIYTLVGLSFIAAYLTKAIPEMCASLLNGSSAGGGASIGGFTAALATGAAALATGGLGLAAGAAATGAGATAGAATGAAAGAAAGGAASAASGGLASGLAKVASEIPQGIASMLQDKANFGGGSSDSGGNFTSRSPSSSASSTPTSSGASANPSSSSRPSATGQARTPVSALHGAASAAVKATGIMTAISTPGAEGLHNLSLGSLPANASDTSDPNASSSQSAGESSDEDNWKASAELQARNAVSTDVPPTSPDADVARSADPGPSISNPKKD